MKSYSCGVSGRVTAVHPGLVLERVHQLDMMSTRFRYHPSPTSASALHPPPRFPPQATTDLSVSGDFSVLEFYTSAIT